MTILHAQNLSITYGTFDVFYGISLSVAKDQKIGLIGPNGVGKTSLLLILAGIQSPTTGTVNFARNHSLGYLRQEAVDAFADREHTVYEEMLTIFTAEQAQQRRLNELEAQMASDSFDEKLLQTYSKLQSEFELAGGYEYEVRIQKTLQGLGLGSETWHSPLNHLSGGQKTRALLARLLLEKPDLLMLDEPTNHLDLDAVEWLERTLRDWPGAVLIVSHDRAFLDNSVNVIWEMGQERIDIYPGNYSSYLLQRQERWEYYERVFTEEKERLQKEVDFVQRNWVRDSTHARALGRLRQLSRDLAIVENYGIMALRNGKQWIEMDLRADRPLDVVEAVRKVNAISLSSNRPLKIKPRLKTDQSGSEIILRAKYLKAGYPGNVLFSVSDLELRRRECAALIGPNGSGKTTFLKTLLGQLEPLEGEVQVGAGLKIGYFAQAHDSLNASHSVLEELARHKEMPEGEARSYLATYLFRGEDVFKPVNALSGGERARLALAILALEGSDFLVLDEPTNHLDIPAREALQEVLDDFSGTILLVSHDRYLIDELATQIWELSDGLFKVFHGNYKEYVLRRAAPSSTHAQRILLPRKPLIRGDGKESRKRAQALARLEERIEEQEKIVKRLYHDLEKPGQKRPVGTALELSRKAAAEQAELDKLMSEWEKLVME